MTGEVNFEAPSLDFPAAPAAKPTLAQAEEPAAAAGATLRPAPAPRAPALTLLRMLPRPAIARPAAPDPGPIPAPADSLLLLTRASRTRPPAGMSEQQRKEMEELAELEAWAG
jgi:hypothetical protein